MAKFVVRFALTKVAGRLPDLSTLPPEKQTSAYLRQCMEFCPDEVDIDDITIVSRRIVHPGLESAELYLTEDGLCAASDAPEGAVGEGASPLTVTEGVSIEGGEVVGYPTPVVEYEVEGDPDPDEFLRHVGESQVSLEIPELNAGQPCYYEDHNNWSEVVFALFSGKAPEAEDPPSPAPPQPCSVFPSAGDIRESLLEVARCPLIRERVEASGSGPCDGVIDAQVDLPLEARQVAEPWSGDIFNAKVLLLLSGPQLGAEDAHPAWGSPDDDVTHFFTRRFEASMAEGARPLQTDGEHGAPLVAWARARNVVEELKGNARAWPGEDYAITHVVHCRGKDREALAGAASACAARYLRGPVQLAYARVVVALGDVAGHALRSVLRSAGGELTDEDLFHGPVMSEGRNRVFLFLPDAPDAPNLESLVGFERLCDAQMFLMQGNL